MKTTCPKCQSTWNVSDERAGQPMGNLDLMIGAQAMAAGLVLVSSDRVFARIKKLKLEDWTV